MAYGKISFDEQLKDNIRRYHSADLYDMQFVEWHIKNICEQFGLELMLTDRHGEQAVTVGDFKDYVYDVVKQPGIRVRIYNHTTGHLYVKTEDVTKEAGLAIDMLVKLLEHWGTQSYLAKELAEYRGTVEAQTQERNKANDDERRDVLTGTLSKTYFESRLRVIDRAEVAPVALIQANINDWKFFHDNFGIEESDRLIEVVGKTIKELAKPEYVIGRCEGDLFNIIIPMPEEQEAEDYVSRLRNAFDDFEDDVLVPSVAFGIVYKYNVEESLFDKLSDAEYEMFNDKLQIKNAPGYREKIEKGKRE